MRLGIIAFLVAMMLPNMALAQTENRYDPYGSRGDAGTDLRCSPGSFVVGFAGFSGTNIDRIQLVCAKIGADGFALPSTETSALIGGPGGGPNSSACSPDTFLLAINVWLVTTKNQVYFIMGDCTRTRNGVASALNFGAPWKPGGLFSPYPTREYKCPVGMAITGLTLRYGKHINGAGAICGTIVRQPAPPVVVTPPAPARTGRVVDFGAPRNGEPRPPTPKMPSFVGRWTLTSRTGLSAVLVLQEADGNDLIGTLTSADPRYNGRVNATAAVSGRNFTFTWKDDATGKTGNGKMVYRGSDPKGILGTISSDGPPVDSVVWGGARP